MNRAPYLLLADDLTGACDAAVQFVRHGLPASVMLESDPPPLRARVIALTTESRNLSEPEAASAVRQAASQWTGEVVFKKIDSVLRGHPAAEIRAALDAFDCAAAVATPAFPALGRVNGPEAAEALRSDRHVPPDGVSAALASGARVVSADVACDADLDAIVSGARGMRVLWAGSGGLAGALARSLGAPLAAPPAMHRAPLLFCIGSDHPVTIRQVAELRQARPESVILPLGPLPECAALLLSGGDTASAVCREAGVRRIDLYGEVLPGIPWGVLRCGRLDGVPVVTKSGGFGQPDALLRVAEFFA